MYRHKTKSMLAGVSCSIIIGCFFSYASAQELAQESDDEPVINVQLNSGGFNAAPAPTVLTTRITQQDITAKQVDDVNDINRLDPSVHYNSSNNSFNIRGLDANRVLTTIDGIRIPWLNDGARGVSGGISTFDFASLSTLDIIKGADSSLYGSGALGGVIALRTLDPEDLLDGDKNWASLTKLSYDSTDRSWRVNQALAMRANQTYILLQGGYKAGQQRDNYMSSGGYGPQRLSENPADYDESNLLFKIYQHVDGAHRFGFTAERYDYDNDIHALNTSTATYQAGSYYDRIERGRERYSLSYDYDAPGQGWLDEAHAIVYWQRQTLDETVQGLRLTTPKGNYLRHNQMQETSYGLTANGMKRIDLDAISHTLRFAVDGSGSKFEQYAAGQDNCPPPPYGRAYYGCTFLHTNQSDTPDIETLVASIAVEDEIGFLQDRLRATFGLRYDWYEHKPQETYSYSINSGFSGYPDSNSGSQLSPKIRMEWDATTLVTFYGQYARGFRAPSATELYMDYTAPGLYSVSGNEYLTPETSDGFELGALLGDDDLGGRVSLFTNKYKNFIDLDDLGGDREFVMFRQQYVNRDRVRISGVEAEAHWQIDEFWRTTLNLTYAEGKDLENDQYLNTIPALKAVFGLGYQRENWGSNLYVTAAAKRDKVEDDSENLITPGYAKVDITAWWQPLGETGPALQAGVYNLFDKKYWDALRLDSSSSLDRDYYTEPGRTFKISMTQRF